MSASEQKRSTFKNENMNKHRRGMGTIPAFNVIFQKIERLIPTLPCTMHMSSSLDSIKDKRPENRGHNNSKNNKIALIQSNIYFILGKFRSNINSHGNET